MTLNQTRVVRQFVKYLALSCTIFSLLYLITPPIALAKTCVDPATGTKTQNMTVCDPPLCEEGKLCNPTTYKDINDLLLAVVKEVMKYGLLLIVFFLVLAGFKFVVAQGNPEKINEAKKMLVWVIVGAFVLIGVLVIREAVCGTVDKIRGIAPTEPSDSLKRACPTTPP